MAAKAKPISYGDHVDLDSVPSARKEPSSSSPGETITHHHYEGNVLLEGEEAETYSPPRESSPIIDELEPLPDDFRELSSHELTYIGNKTFVYTLIWIGSDPESRLYVKIVKDEHQLYSLKFGQKDKSGKLVDAPEPLKLAGKFTDPKTIWSALAKYCDEQGLKLEISYVSEDGSDRMRVNPKAIH